MKIYLLNPTYQLGSNSYLIEIDGELALIDPSVNPESVDIDYKRLKYIFLTHTHFDHMLFIDEWVEKTTLTPIVGYGDEDGLTDSSINCYLPFLRRDKTYKGAYLTAKDGDSFPLGNKKIKVIHTPGHTKGSVSLLIDDAIFVGDVVFAGLSYGRCDLPGGNYSILMRSIKALLAYPQSFIVYPGHGPQTTIKELKNNY